MAENSQGISVTVSGDFGTITLGELVSVSVDGVKADAVEFTSRSGASRHKAFRPGDVDLGTVSCTFRTGTSVTTDLVGAVGMISVGTIYSGSCIIESLAWSASVGALQEYRATFKLGALT